MVRILKNPDDRKAEILDAAWQLFNTKGFEATSVNDILQKVGIAKGTFYYYFKSKDEVLDNVIERGINEQAAVLEVITENQSLNALEKIKKILVADKELHVKNAEVLNYLHKKENIVMHQKSLVLTIQKLSPILAEVIHQGIKENLFKTNYPQAVVELILAGMSFLLDPSIFSWSKEEYLIRVKALADVLETSLRADQGSFAFLSDMAEQMIHYS